LNPIPAAADAGMAHLLQQIEQVASRGKIAKTPADTEFEGQME